MSDTYVRCKLCKRKFKMITSSHLKKYHNTSITRYIKVFGRKDLVAKKTMRKISSALNAYYSEHDGPNKNKKMRKRTLKERAHLKKVLENRRITWGDKISKTQKKRKTNRGENNPMYGKHHTASAKKLISKGSKKLKHSKDSKKRISLKTRLEKNAMWKGGLSYEAYGMSYTQKLKNEIRCRDNHCCQNPQCEHKNSKSVRLDVHHIDFNKKNSKKKNLILICKYCHAKTTAAKDRKYWTKYYKEIINTKFRGR